MSLAHVKSVIVVFAMPGCPACEEYKPRLEAHVNHWIAQGAPIFWYTGGEVPAGQIPVQLLDAESPDESVISLAEQYNVQAVPCTLVLTRRKRPVVLEGALTDQQIHDALSAAYRANR